jgi:agmatinase
MENKPVCYEPGREIPEIFQGIPSFMGLPIIETQKEIAECDVVVLGSPWEGVVTWGGFSGVELATKSIRSVSIRYSGYIPEMGFDIFDYFKGGDYGDSPTTPGSIEQTFNQIQAKVSAVYEAGAVPFIFGGDHSTTIPAVRALAANTKGNVGILHFDAHMDNMDFYGDERFSRCSPLHRIYEIENVDPKNIIHIGIRGPRNNPKQVAAAKEHGATILTSFEIKQKGIDYAIDKALEVVKSGTAAVYITICSDILDVAYNPGGAADLNGLTSFELSFMLHKFACEGINGFDFTEVSPLSDVNHVSSHTAVWMALYAMSGMVKNRFDVNKLAE